MSILNNNQIDINKQLKRTAKDSLIYVPAMVLPAIIGILLIRILTTIFTPEEYGYYQITLSTFGLIRVFSLTWLSSSVVRFYLNHKNSNQEGVFFSTLFFCAIIGSVIVAVISLFISHQIFQNRITPILFSLINLSIIASVFNAFFEIFVVVFRAGLKPKKYSLFWILFSVSKPILGICLILWFGFRVDGIFWAFLVVPLLLDIIVFFQLDLHKNVKISFISYGLFRQFLQYGLPISFSFLSFWILSLSDRYLVEFFRGSAEVGLYSVGYTISEKTLNFIYTILMLAAFPIIVDNWEKHGDESTKKLITELTRYFLFLCVPILIILSAIPEKVFLIFSNEQFEEGAKVLPLIAGGIFLNGLTQYVLKGFELHKKSYKIALLALLAGLMNIGLNVVLIPRYGFLGAGISACVAYLIYFITAAYLVRNDMAWEPPYRSIFNIIISATILALFLIRSSHLHVSLLYVAFIQIPLGVIIFFSILILLKEIKIYEIQRGWNFLLGLVKGLK